MAQATFAVAWSGGNTARGHIKQARGFRQFLLRGIEKVSGEWAMICTAHNLAKLTA